MQLTVFNNPGCILLAGASGGLGNALCSELVECFPDATLLTVSRSDLGARSETHHHLCAPLDDEGSVKTVGDWLREQPVPSWVIDCCGTLHWPDHSPEKNLQQCTDEALLQSISVNVLTHLHLAQALAPLLQKRSPLVWASLSAKVGSIEDNHLGGWYSYRMSKAALNMLVRNLSIEWSRKVEDCCVVAIHPGTTDTSLSKPFQSNIPDGKLYSPQQSAARIVRVLAQLQPKDNGKLLFWDGSPIPW